MAGSLGGDNLEHAFKTLRARRRLMPGVLWCLTALFVVGPKLPAYGEVGDLLSLVSAVLTAYLAARAIHVGALNTVGLGDLGACLLGIAAYSALVVACSPLFEPYYLVRGVRLLLNFFGGVALVLLYRDRYGTRLAPALLRDTFVVLTLHAVIMAAQFAMPAFRAAVYTFTQPSIVGDNLEYRMAGLTGGAGSSVSFLQFVGVLLAPGVWAYTSSIRGRVVVVIAAVLNLIAALLAGRTGLYFSLLMTPIAIVATLRGIRHHRDSLGSSTGQSLWRPVVAISLAVVVLALAADRVTTYLEAQGLGLSVLRAVTRGFESYLTYRETGQVQEQTLAHLLAEHLYIPDEPLLFFFGNGQYENETVRSDIGYVKTLYGLGLVGVFLSILFYVVLVRYAWRFRGGEPVLATISILLAISLVLAHVKEPFLFVRYFFSVSVIAIVGVLASPRTLVRVRHRFDQRGSHEVGALASSLPSR